MFSKRSANKVISNLMKRSMKLLITNAVFVFIFFVSSIACNQVFAQDSSSKGYVVEKEEEISKNDTGPHHGGGETIAFSFFDNLKDLDFVFRKRILKPGSGIGYHLQESDEIYYILYGSGEMKMNDEVFKVLPGTAVLTRAGSSHGLQQVGDEDLIIFIVYMSE